MNYQIINGEEIAKDIAAIQNKLTDLLPLNGTGVKPFIHKRSGIVTFYTEKPTHADDLVGKLINERNYTLLYYVMDHDGKCYDAALISNLSEEPMHCILFRSAQFGLVDNFAVCFFDSLDKMYEYASKLWESSLNLRGIRSEAGIESEGELACLFADL